MQTDSSRPNASLPEARPEPLPLLDRLAAAAQRWSEATGRSLGALSSIVTNHGGFFDRIGTPGAGANTATLEKFARFLADAANWPGGAVPQEAAAFAHAVGVSPMAAAESPGKSGQISPSARAA